MKKLIICAALLLSLIGKSVLALDQASLPAQAGMAIDVRTGKVLYEKNADQVLPVGNLSRVATLYLVYQAVAQGQISWEDKVTPSDLAYELSYQPDISSLQLTADHYTVKDLTKASLMSASVAATRALAEHVAGSDEAATLKIRELLRDWQLNSDGIINASAVNNAYLGEEILTGSQVDEENQLSARDVITISYRLVKDFPEVLELAEATRGKFGGDDLYTFNYLLENMPHNRPNAYGLMTGSSDQSGSHLISLSYENLMQVMVVMIDVEGGREDTDKRFVVANHFLDQIGDAFHLQKVIPASTSYKDTPAPVLDGVKPTTSAVTLDDFYVVTTPATVNTFRLKPVFPDKTNYAPIKEGQVVGQLVFDDQVLIGQGYLEELPSMPLVTEETVERTHIFEVIWNHFVRYVLENL